MARIRADRQELYHKPDPQQQRDELQGAAYDDPPGQVVDQDHVFLGQRKAYRTLPKRIQLPPQQVAKQSHGVQQLDQKNGQS